MDRSSVLALLVLGCGAGMKRPSASIPQFEERLEQLRTESRIAAVTAVITRNQEVVWIRHFGLADLAGGRSPTDSTVYHLASLTKPFASTVLMALVEEGRVSLDDPVSQYGVTLPGPGVILVRHLLSHTSEGVPGTSFRYNGNRFALLDSVIARGAGMPFAEALQGRIIARLGLRHTAPNPQSGVFTVTGLDRAAFEAGMAKGYAPAGSGYIPTAYPSHFSSAAGLTASALDVAAFSMAMDRNVLLRAETKELALTPAVNPAGDTLPYGLGWFSTRYRGVRVVWQYGLWTANSSLLLKVPEHQLTFILLANTDGLSAPYQLGAGKLDSSPWAREFLDTFVFGSVTFPGAAATPR
jgi:CubicO group peptidase (beta-lactamase class C family)